MAIEQITRIVVIGTVVAWLIWDIVLYGLRTKDKKVSTISMMLTRFSWYSPALPMAAGILLGHWFWPA